MYLFIQLSKNSSEVLIFIMSVLCIGAILVSLFLLPETSRIFGKNGRSLRILKVLAFIVFLLIIIELSFFISKLNSIGPNTTLSFQFLILIIVFLWLIRRYLLVNLIRKNIISIKYRTYLILRKSLVEIITIVFFFVVQKIIFFYKNNPLGMFFALCIYAYITKSILLLAFFWCQWMYDSILEVEYFKEFKRIRSQDIRSFNYHWNFDRDLIFFNKFLILIYLFSLSVFYFSYFFLYTSLGELGIEYKFVLLNCSVSIKEVQYFLGMNFIGPILLAFCLLLKFVLNIHVIMCRNPSTIFKGFASTATTANVLAGGAILISSVGVSLTFSSNYHSCIGPENVIKNSTDTLFDGVVRHTKHQDTTFNVLKKLKSNINSVDITDPKTGVLSLPKLHVELGLTKNSSLLKDITAIELKAMGFTDLISEIKLLRHNLNVLANMDQGIFTKEDYISRFNADDKADRLSFGVNLPSKDEMHQHYQAIASKVCVDSKSIKRFTSFINGESDEFFYSIEFQRQFGVLNTERSTVSSIYVPNLHKDVKSDYERIAANLPKSLVTPDNSNPLDISNFSEPEKPMGAKKKKTVRFFIPEEQEPKEK